MKLYDYVLSPSCYKVRLFAALVGAKLDLVPVDFHPGQEHKGETLRALNPAGSLPILQDDGFVLTESSAILSYLGGAPRTGLAGSG